MSRDEPGLAVAIPSIGSSSSTSSSLPSPYAEPKSPITPVDSPQKLAARCFLIFFTLMYTIEVVFWFTSNEIDFPHYFDFYSTTSEDIQIPQILSPMSAQAVFTHFMIHVEKIFVRSNPKDPSPLPPEPVVGWHPFSNFKNEQWSTILLKFHFVLHNFTLVLTFIGCIIYGKMVNSIDTLLLILIYNFFTIMVSTIRLRHDTLELEKMAEYSFTVGLGTIFICIFLASETFGCFFYDTDAILRTNTTRLADTSDFDYGPRKCFSTLYGNFMLSWNALFANIAYVLLYWLVDSDFRVIGLMRLQLPRQYVVAFIMQTLASVVFIFFFSQKEFPTEFIDVWWPFAKLVYMGMWGFSILVLCFKNIPSLSEVGFNSSFFSERHMLVISDPKDKETLRSLSGLAVEMNEIKISAEADALQKEETQVTKYKEEDTDMVLGGGGELHVEKRQSKPGEYKVIQSKSTDALKLPSEEESPETLSRRIGAALEPSKESTRPTSPIQKLRKHIKKYSWLNKSMRVRRAIHKGVTSKKMFVLRFVLMFFTYFLVGITISMIVSFNEFKNYIFEMIYLLSYCAFFVHYSIMVNHPMIYNKKAFLEMKPLWVPVYEDGRLIRSKFRLDRLIQVLVAPKLQYYLHITCVFGWKIYAGAFSVGDYSIMDVPVGIVSFIISIFIYYYIIRRMCAALRQRMEPGYTTDSGVALREQLFLDGMKSMAVTLFFVLEVSGCVLQVHLDSDLTEDDLEKECRLYRLANSCMAMNIVFLQMMNHLTFNEMSGVELFTFKMRRYHLFAFFFALLPLYSATFLFSRREQVDSLDLGALHLNESPFFKIATKIGADFFTFIWIIIFIILGRKAKKVRDYDFIASDIAFIKDRFAPEEADDREVDERERSSLKSWEKLRQNKEVVAAAMRQSDASGETESDAKVLKRGRAVTAITKFKDNQKIYEGRKVSHRRLWILKVILLIGTMLFVFAQFIYLVLEVTTESDDASESAKIAKSVAYIAQPLSFACCMMHYFCDIDIENENIGVSQRRKLAELLGAAAGGRGSIFEYFHISLHIVAHTIMPMITYGLEGGDMVANTVASACIFFLWLYFLFLCREVRVELDKKHKTLLEIEKTLERFFAECFAALLVIIYVTFESSGCVEWASAEADLNIDADCTSYIDSARIFATTMAVPLILYVATFVADLSAYDILTGNVNFVLALGLFMTFCTGGIAVYAFAIRTWSFDPANLPLFYSLNFIDFWEVVMFGAINLVLRGVLNDCRQLSLDNKEKNEILSLLEEDERVVEKEIEDLDDIIQMSLDKGDFGMVDKLGRTYASLKKSKKEMKQRRVTLTQMNTLTKQEASEALHRNKAKVMRRHSIIAEKNILINEADTESQLRHCRIIRQLNEPDVDADIRERELIRTKFGSHDGLDEG
eukprot:CAMPEP_0118665476 /NCGR_PEP_ID=MMETSP0785-20121206/18643_1 /TAXON_ID=91992 /ORGANISM="Bolidomonas pacifica, Strain CCMP 1866" /LENGTH=1406 /DNA_ID=CAMNT_0006559605 /DNA_START=152 /DNA_END=4368 /DNA_ORIENTATION=+